MDGRRYVVHAQGHTTDGRVIVPEDIPRLESEVRDLLGQYDLVGVRVVVEDFDGPALEPPFVLGHVPATDPVEVVDYELPVSGVTGDLESEDLAALTKAELETLVLDQGLEAKVIGTGADGRVLKEDLIRALNEGAGTAAAPETAG